MSSVYNETTSRLGSRYHEHEILCVWLDAGLEDQA